MGDGRRGRLISASDRRQAVELISEAVDSGAALYKACAELGISKRSYNRWKNNTNDYIDERITCTRPEPANKLTQEERTQILDVMNSEEFSSKTPCEIVPILADQGIYLGSESTFYKILKETEMLAADTATLCPCLSSYQSPDTLKEIRFPSSAEKVFPSC